MPRHINKRLDERGLSINPEILQRMVNRCEGDTALILFKLEKCNKDYPDNNYCSRKESNGDLVVLVVRHKYPITIMYRRRSQDKDLDSMKVALNVNSAYDISDIIKNYKIKEK